MVSLYEELPVNECFVTSMVGRQSDDLVIGATVGKKEICLFSFDHRTSRVKMLDSFAAPWWDEPVVALGAEGDIYLGARRAYDKPFVFERLRERPHTPGAFRRRESVPPAGMVNEDVAGLPIRHYSPAGALLDEIELPEFPDEDGVGALAVCAAGEMLCGLSAPGGRLFTISLESGEKKDYGEVARLPERHHTRRISRVLMVADNGKVYLCGTLPEEQEKAGTEDAMGFMLELDPLTGELKRLEARLPAVTGRRRFAAVDAAVELSDGSFLGGTTDGYLFRFDPESGDLEGFGKPLRQQRIVGLANGADGLVYGVGGESGGLPRLFAFDPAGRQMHLGSSPTGAQAGITLFGDIGAVVGTADGTMICGERERRSYLLVYRRR